MRIVTLALALLSASAAFAAQPAPPAWATFCLLAAESRERLAVVIFGAEPTLLDLRCGLQRRVLATR
jgi:hypothetical protein